MASTLRQKLSPWFVLSDSPGIAYRAERFGDDWNGWATPVFTAPTLVILLLTVISDPDSTYVAFAIDEAGTCTLQDHQGRLDTLEPADDGGYAWVGRSATTTSSSLGKTMSHRASEEFQAVKITVAGVVEKVSLDRAQLLQSLYAQIGCRYVEVVQPTDTICLWVDEEGLINRSSRTSSPVSWRPRWESLGRYCTARLW